MLETVKVFGTQLEDWSFVIGPGVRLRVLVVIKKLQGVGGDLLWKGHMKAHSFFSNVAFYPI